MCDILRHFNFMSSALDQSTTSTMSDFLLMNVDMVMLYNATFNNISAITWRSALLVDEIGVSEENHRPVASH
jgi:hypothetical protein